MRRSAADAFDLFTSHIASWWPLPMHGLFGPASGSVEFTDGRVVERAVDGRETVWAEVTRWEPPTRLTLAWHPGTTPEDASDVDVRFVPDEHGTRVEVTHHGWERFGLAAEERRRGYAGPNAWGGVLDQFADVADRAAMAPLGGLADAYEAFFAEASIDGFDPPAADEWTAHQVIAHIALNDAALMAVCRSILDRSEPRFDNSHSQSRPVLDAFVARFHSDLASLVRNGRASASSFRLLIGRLSERQLETPVPCMLTDNGVVVRDGELPWGQLAIETQAAFHLPLHTQQLRGLREGGPEAT